MNPNPGRVLRLDAYSGEHISNSVDADPSPNAIALSRLGIGAFVPHQVTGPPTGRYNCHGLVFANRRTNVPEAGDPADYQIDHLLDQDIYAPVRGIARLGDVVVYRRHASGHIDHTGIVSRVEHIGATAVVFVWSKWGALEECEHVSTVCSYAQTCDIEYWRLVP